MVSRRNRELAAERREEMRRILRQRGALRVDEIGRALNVSPATVRRDLAELDRLGHIRRVHGGAVSIDGRLEEPLFDDKTAIAAREKQRIAQAALKFVKPNDSIYLDGGSTVLALARLLADRNNLTVVTNSLRVAVTLSGGGPRMLIVGGEFRRISQTIVGPLTRPLIDELHVDRAFMGTIGLSDKEGVTTTDPREAYTKALVVDNARQTVLLADSSKLGKVSFVKVGPADSVDVLITDKGAGKKELTGLRKKGIRTITV
jgi:DeoR/GlpR family transcriptional regulator of sugar metabolism